MPNSTAITDTFKRGMLTGNVNLNTATIKAALYYTGSNVNNANAIYTGVSGTAGEVAGAGYTAGGITTTAGTAGLLSNIAYWQPGAALSYGTVTLSTAFDTVLLYYTNSVTANTIASFNFGSTTVNNGTFTINLPTNNETTALIRLT